MRLFVTANEARKFGIGNVRVVHEEVRHIETKILDALDAGRLDVLVVDSPIGIGAEGIPSPVEYWRVWRTEREDRVLQMHLDAVVNYFTNLGYSIAPRTNPNTSNTIAWAVHW